MNPEHDWFNCWVCGFKGRNLAPIMVPGSAEHQEYLTERPEGSHTSDPSEQGLPRCSALPDEFIPLGRSAPSTASPYLTYLAGRGIDRRTVGLYRMGYVDRGPYSGRVIVPSFDRFGCVNLFSARTIFPDVRPTYKFPVASKDVVSNEHMVDWTRPVYLVEGIFDELAVGPQGIALYGKFLPPSLAVRLVEKRPPMVYVCLDADARREALALVERLMGYDLQCSIVDLQGKDPSSVGLQGVLDASAKARTVSGSVDLVRAEGRL